MSPVRDRLPTGQGKLEKVGEFLWFGNSGKGQGKILFSKSKGKVGENDLGSCRLWISVNLCVFKYKKAGKFVASIEHPKARSVSASGGLHLS